jgi:hypothetical protein
LDDIFLFTCFIRNAEEITILPATDYLLTQDLNSSNPFRYWESNLGGMVEGM